MIALAWVIFAAVVIGTILFCYAIVKYYQDRHEAEIIPTVVTVIALSLSLFCVFLIPVDIYIVSSTHDHEGRPLMTPEEISVRKTAVRVLYYILYSFILAFAFGIIPFAYFYYEEDDEQVTFRQRCWGGCKYTIFIILIVVILLAVGLFLFLVKPGDKPTNSTDAKAWVETIMSQENIVESSIGFAIACLTLIGYLALISYTAYGLSGFPIGIIKGRKHLAEEISNVNNDLETTREQSRVIQAKYLSGNKKISKKDQGQLDLLSRREKILAKQGTRLHNEQTGWRKVVSALKPFAFLFGFFFIIISLLLVISIFLTSIDKAVNATNFCGAQCGFVLAYPKIFNPLDQLLTILSSYFPLDYIFLGFLILYIFFSSLSGIISIGIRFLWVHLYSIRPRLTPPQGLLMTSALLMFIILALNMEITTLAPQYANWGSQVYIPENSTQLNPCSLDAPEGDCTMTQIGEFINRISIRTSFFGIIYFALNWVFLLVWIIGLVIAIIKAKKSNIEQHETDSEDEE